MSASKENSLKLSGDALGIIAGGGEIPRQLTDLCVQHNIPFKVVGFKKFTTSVNPDYWARLSQATKTIQWLKGEGIQDLVMIGAIKRPTIFDLWPDILTLRFLVKVWVRSFGDSDLLSEARKELERQGFSIHGIHRFLPDMLFSEGVIGAVNPSSAQEQDIKLGVIEAQALGRADIGQAVIVKDGKLIAVEDKKGTSAMIKRYGCEGAILVKTCKPQQDMDLDLPTIGLNTVEQCAEKKMAGIVGHAGKSLLVNRQEAIAKANETNIFLYGATVSK